MNAIKKYKIGLIISAFVIVIAGAALSLPRWIHKDFEAIKINTENKKEQGIGLGKNDVASNTPQEIQKKVKTNEDSQQDQDQKADGDQDLASNASKKVVANEKAQGVDGETTAGDTDGSLQEEENTQEDASNAIKEQEKNVETTPEEANEATSNNDPKVKDEWVQEKIDTNREEIEDIDLEAGTEIYNRLNTDYIFSLLDAGLTDQEKIELETYLHQELTDDEYTLTLQLIEEYKGLVQ